MPRRCCGTKGANPLGSPKPTKKWLKLFVTVSPETVTFLYRAFRTISNGPPGNAATSRRHQGGRPPLGSPSRPKNGSNFCHRFCGNCDFFVQNVRGQHPENLMRSIFLSNCRNLSLQSTTKPKQQILLKVFGRWDTAKRTFFKRTLPDNVILQKNHNFFQKNLKKLLTFALHYGIIPEKHKNNPFGKERQR
jgi:hypothetical protein